MWKKRWILKICLCQRTFKTSGNTRILNAKHLVESDFLNKDSLESNISILCLVIAAFASKTLRFITANFISHYFHICKNSYASNLYSALHCWQRGRVREWENWIYWYERENERMKGMMGLYSLIDRERREVRGGPQQRGEERSKGRGKEWREETFTETAGAPLYWIWWASHLAVMQSEGWRDRGVIKWDAICYFYASTLSSSPFLSLAPLSAVHLIE